MAIADSQLDANDVRLGDFVLSLRPLRLSKGGKDVALRNRGLRLLALLVENRGNLVTHDDIKAALWADRQVDVARGIHVCIGEVRQALEDDPDKPAYIETLPRQGYRFIGSIEPIFERQAPAHKRTDRARSIAVGVSATVILALALLGVFIFTTSPERQHETTIGPTTAAEEAYQKGEFLLEKGTYEDLDRSAAYFAEALSRKSDFAKAYLGLSEIEIRRGNFQLAASQIRKAEESDPEEPLVHLHLGRIAMWGDWDWKKARHELGLYVASAPNSAKGHMFMAWLHVIEGDATNARREANLAYRLDPVSSLVLAGYGQVHYFTRDYQTALKYCEEATALGSEEKEFRIPPLADQAYRCILMAAIKLDRLNIAQSAAAELSETLMKNPKLADRIRVTTPKEALTTYFTQSREFTEIVAANDERLVAASAEAYVNTGEYERAADSLARGVETRYPLMPLLVRDPIFDAIRNEPEFEIILRSMNLPPLPGD